MRKQFVKEDLFTSYESPFTVNIKLIDNGHLDFDFDYKGYWALITPRLITEDLLYRIQSPNEMLEHPSNIHIDNLVSQCESVLLQWANKDLNVITEGEDE